MQLERSAIDAAERIRELEQALERTQARLQRRREHERNSVARLREGVVYWQNQAADIRRALDELQSRRRYEYNIAQQHMMSQQQAMAANQQMLQNAAFAQQLLQNAAFAQQLLNVGSPPISEGDLAVYRERICNCVPARSAFLR